MKNLSLFLAGRYLWQSAYEKNISAMVYISVLSILIGSFALALVSAVMNGFEDEIHKKFQGIHANIIIRSGGQQLNAKAIQKVMESEFPEVTGFSPASLEHAILRPEKNDRAPLVVLLKGINAKQEDQVSTIGQKVLPKTEDKKPLATMVKNNKVLIGKRLAKDLGVKVGDEIQMFFTSDLEKKRKRISMDSSNIIIGGIFDTGIDEFDSGFVYCSLDLLNELFPDSGVSQINLKIPSHVNEQDLVERLRDRFGLPVFSWKDLYPALVSALTLEKYVMFLILALITLVASMNIISLLFMQITQKRPDIAIYKAMGMPDYKISRIFMYIGLSIANVATLIGLALACLASYILKKYPFIELPDAYYVSHLPAHMTLGILIAVYVVVIFLTLGATLLPSRRIRTINISQVLRFEG